MTLSVTLLRYNANNETKFGQLKKNKGNNLSIKMQERIKSQFNTAHIDQHVYILNYETYAITYRENTGNT